MPLHAAAASLRSATRRLYDQRAQTSARAGTASTMTMATMGVSLLARAPVAGLGRRSRASGRGRDRLVVLVVGVRQELGVDRHDRVGRRELGHVERRGLHGARSGRRPGATAVE